jgi:hypothetical protein
MRGIWSRIALAVAVGVPAAAQAHEFIVKPAAMTVQAGVELPVAGLSSQTRATRWGCVPSLAAIL